MNRVSHFRDLEVYKQAKRVALKASEISRGIPREERRLFEQLVNAARSPGACIPEAWRKRPYRKFWINKLSDALGECGESEWWADIVHSEKYCSDQQYADYLEETRILTAQLITMLSNHDKWITKN